MTTAKLKFDEIGAWSLLKLEIIEKYGSAYTNAFSNNRLKKYYIDGFSGAGMHLTKGTKEQVEGSPVRALKIEPPFDWLYFIDMNKKKTAYLENLCDGRKNVTIHTGDTNIYLRELLPTINYKNYNRALCILDPYGMHLDWEITQIAGQSEAIDMFLNFPVMDINMNAVWKNPENMPQDGIDRMNRFWGDSSWRNVAYAESKQGSLFGGPDIEKQDNQTIAAAFKERLKQVGGFEYVAEPLPMRNSNNAIVYYLFFAAKKPVALKIINDVLKKYR